jgi:hypothetical protein
MELKFNNTVVYQVNILIYKVLLLIPFKHRATFDEHVIQMVVDI